jgi:cbb3-type cytochrome oxidase maturation protein
MYLLIPLSVLLVLVIGAVLTWAVMTGQFEDLEAEGGRILQDEGQDPDHDFGAGDTGAHDA